MKRFISFLLLSAIYSFFLQPLAWSTPGTITLAVLAKRGREATVKRWQPLVDHLNRLTPYTIQLEPLPFEALERAVRSGTVDLVLANPAMFVKFEVCCGLAPIVTMKNLKFGRAYTRFGGVIFTRADRKDLRRLKDLKRGKILVGAVDPDSFGGWLMQWREFRRAGLKRGRDFRVRFYGTHDAVVYAVLRGEVDVGCVRTDTLETMSAEGKIRLRDFRILHPRHHPGFDLLVSTDLYPEWPLARTPRLSDEVAELLASVLLALPSSSEVARKSGAAWTIPHNYQPVHECLRELGVGPYAELRAHLLREARKKYQRIVASLILLSIVGSLVTFYILSLHRRLAQAYREVEEHRDHLEEQVKERTAHLEALAQRLREERERLAVILESLADAVIVTDTRARVLLLNPAAEKLLGIRAEEAQGKDFCELVPLELIKTTEGCRSVLNSSQQTQRVDFGEVVLRLPSGKEVLVEGTATPVLGAGGEVQGSVIVLRDITLRKKLEEEARKTTKLEALSLVASGLAHDFNNLLATIMGYLEVLRLRGGEELAPLVEKAERACLTARTLTRELLTYTAGGGPVKRMASIEEVLREAVEFAMAGSGIRVEMEQETLWPVEMDPDQIAVCLHNILLNARQAMGDRGTVFVRATNRHLPRENPAGLPPGPYVEIEIEDTGPGIPPEVLTRLFEPFFTTREGGSGLGLFTCRRIVEAHGGRIVAESPPGRGAVFRLYLPAHPEVERPRDTEKETRIEPRVSARILVMDDEEGVRETLAEILRLNGFEVETARDGNEALEKFRKALSEGRPFGLVILDLTVPGGLGGREILPRLKELDPEVRTVVASGYSQDPVMENFREHGFDGALLKPFTARDLIETISRILAPGRE